MPSRLSLRTCFGADVGVAVTTTFGDDWCRWGGPDDPRHLSTNVLVEAGAAAGVLQ
jgi:hypothetical protein